MSRILVVEDEKSYQNLYRDIFGRLEVPSEWVVFKESYNQALRWINTHSAELQVAMIDLKIPRDMQAAFADGDKDLESAEPLGFGLIQALRSKNRDCEIIIISNFADEAPERGMLKRLRQQGVWVDSILHKQYDLDMAPTGRMKTPAGIEMLRNYVEPIESDLRLLEKHGIYARHPRLEKIVRKLKYVYRSVPDRWPTPTFMFHGSPGSGKNNWAKAAAILKNPDQTPVIETESLGAMPDHLSGDSVSIRLFGAREFERKNSKGLFERATRYVGRLPEQLARPESVPDFKKSGVAFLDELDSAPSGVVDNLLNMMSEGFVMTAGVKNLRLPIGCSLVFASLKGSELLNGGEHGFLERGENALLAFFDRIPPNHIIEIPELHDLGLDFAVSLLRFRAGRPLQFQPAGLDLLAEGVASGILNIRELCLIHLDLTLPRLTFEQVQKVFGAGTRCRIHAGDFTERELADAREWLSAIKNAVTEVVAAGKKLTKKNLAEYLVSPRSKYRVTPQRLSQIFRNQALRELIRADEIGNSDLIRLMK